MARLDVYPIAARAVWTFLLDVQADVLLSLDTRAVVPLLPDGVFKSPMAALNPILTVNGERFMLLTQAIATVPRRDLRNPVASVLDQHDAVVRALDTLFLGF